MSTSDRVISLDTVDKIFQLSSKSIGIVDIIGHLGSDSELIDDHSLNSATWAVKDMIKEIQQLIEKSPMVESQGDH